MQGWTVSEEFAGHPLEAVSLDSESDVFLGDNHPETVAFKPVTGGKKQDVLVRGPGLRVIEYPGELAGIQQAILAGEGKIAHGYPGQPSSGEALATFGPTTVDNVATGLGCHT